MKLTKKKAIKLHRELWDWLYHHPSKGKRQWPRWKCNGGDLLIVHNKCFLCAYQLRCCPVDWTPYSTCQDHNSFYLRWLEAKTGKTKKKYAKIIRDLPEK